MLRITLARGRRTAAITALLALLILVGPARQAFAADAPTVGSVAPNTGLAAGGTSIVITGAGFVSGATVTVGGAAASGVVWNSATSISAVTPAGTPGATTISVTNPDSQSGTLSNGFTYLDVAPVVTAVNPATGPTSGGTIVTITGTGFRSGAAVTLGGTAATSVAVVNATTITAVAPARAAGTVSVRVTNADGQNGQLADSFVYVAAAAPLVTKVVPASGPTSGGTAVTITGTGFVAGATVTFDGVAATNVSVTNATTITAISPAHAAGAVTVAVRNPDTQTGNLAAGFTYAPGPGVSSVSPANGPTSGGTDVTITGTGFVSGATVSFGGTAATNVKFVSSTRITARTPARATAEVVSVVVTNPGGLAGNLANGFTYTVVLSVTSVTPANGPTGGGTGVVIAGTGFAGGIGVSFGGASAVNVTVVSPAQLIATTPSHAAGAVDVVVTLPGGTKATRSNAFTYQGLSVTSISPPTGTTAGGTPLTLRGSGFAKGVLVFFDGVLGTEVQFVDQTNIRVKTPAHAAGKVNVLVVNPGGSTAVVNDGYRYLLSTPAIHRVTPGVGPATGGSAVSIEGSGFDTGATVEFGGVAGVNVNVVSATLITVVTPPHAPGGVLVTVRNRDGSQAAGNAAFSYEGAGGTLAGTVSANGLSLVTFSGGSNEQLIAAASASCAQHRLGFFTTTAGKWIILLPGAPAAVNAQWNALFPAGLPNMPLLIRCR